MRKIKVVIEVIFIDIKNETLTKSEIKVTVHLPEKVIESMKQLKINRIYNILKGINKNSDSGGDSY